MTAMTGLIMAGGRGSRMRSSHEKLTLGHRRPVVLGVADALDRCGAIAGVVAAVSPHAPQTRALLEDVVSILETPGAGYSADLAYALERLEGPVVVVPGDLPLLDGAILDRVAAAHRPGWWTLLLVTEGYASLLGLSPGIRLTHRSTPCRYTGVSVVDAGVASGAPQRMMIIDDPRLAVNMNTLGDCALLGAAHEPSEHLGL